MDTESGKKDVLLKVVNKSGISESVRITLSGAGKVDPIGTSSWLTGTPDAENALARPNQVVPSSGTFPAGGSLKYLFPAYSITVLRVGLS